MKSIQSALPASWYKSPAATATAIRTLQKESGFKLPEEYTDFLKWADGAEGELGDKFIILWSSDIVVTYNKTYEIDKRLPNVLAVGDDCTYFYAYDYTNNRSSPEAVRFLMSDRSPSAIDLREPDIATLLQGLADKPA